MGQTFVYLNSPSKACVLFCGSLSRVSNFVIRARDKVWLRIMVVVLLFANFLNCGFNVAYLYGVLVTRFGSFLPQSPMYADGFIMPYSGPVCLRARELGCVLPTVGQLTLSHESCSVFYQ
jgi:hypothetical protein